MIKSNSKNIAHYLMLIKMIKKIPKSLLYFQYLKQLQILKINFIKYL